MLTNLVVLLLAAQPTQSQPTQSQSTQSQSTQSQPTQSQLTQSQPLPTGTRLVYRGQLVADQGEPGTGEKHFELSLVIARQGAGGTVYWTLEERGMGGWSWINRFGRIAVDGMLRRTEGVAPTLLYESGEGASLVPLPLPLVSSGEPLGEGVAWTEHGLEHRVNGGERIGDAEAWQVEVRSPIGRKRSMWVDKASPVAFEVRETVFIGQGQQHTLRFELASREALGDARAEATFAAFAEFIGLRERLEIAPQVREFQWTEQRLARLKAELPEIAARAVGTALTRLAEAAAQQSKADRDRSNALGALQGKLVGSVSPRPALETVTGEKFSWDGLQGKVTVLHFWEYRDVPLEEPYGQVAYLDFLCRKHSGGEVRMYGVVADARVAQPDTRRAGIQSARRLHAFMNLSYPLLVDGGDAAKQFGDPRITGAKLPLFVVIDRGGRVVHYHVGHYEVNRDRGLEELESEVMRALDNRG